MSLSSVLEAIRRDDELIVQVKCRNRSINRRDYRRAELRRRVTTTVSRLSWGGEPDTRRLADTSSGR